MVPLMRIVMSISGLGNGCPLIVMDMSSSTISFFVSKVRLRDRPSAGLNRTSSVGPVTSSVATARP
jgi:hypothetical protein